MFECVWPESVGVKTRDVEHRASHGHNDVHVMFDRVFVGLIRWASLLSDALFFADVCKFPFHKFFGIVMN